MFNNILLAVAKELDTILLALGFCAFIWIVYTFAVKAVTRKWLWQERRSRREREEKFERWLKEDARKAELPHYKG